MFKIRFLPEFGRVLSERLDVGGTIYDSTDVKGSSRRYPTIRVRYYPGTRGRPPELTFESSRPVLGQFFDHPDVKNKLDTELARVVVRLAGKCSTSGSVASGFAEILAIPSC